MRNKDKVSNDVILSLPKDLVAALNSRFLIPDSVLYIVGPTASGKSALAHEIAKKYNGAIIAADSRTVYKGMDIGTAKPTQQERAEIDYYCLDLVEPSQRFTVADFKREAEAVIHAIRKQNKLPIIVGGSGLYIDALLFDFTFRDGEFDLHEFDETSLDDLVKRAANYKELTSDDKGNRRRLVRIIQTKGQLPVRKQPSKDAFVIGLRPPKDVQEVRIRKRIEHMFQDGVVEEARSLAEKYGWDAEAMTGDIYPVVRRVLTGEISVVEAQEQCVLVDKKLVKKQLTWFKRYDFIQWYESAEQLIATLKTTHLLQ